MSTVSFAVAVEYPQDGFQVRDKAIRFEELVGGDGQVGLCAQAPADQYLEAPA